MIHGPGINSNIFQTTKAAVIKFSFKGTRSYSHSYLCASGDMKAELEEALEACQRVHPDEEIRKVEILAYDRLMWDYYDWPEGLKIAKGEA